MSLLYECRFSGTHPRDKYTGEVFIFLSGSFGARYVTTVGTDLY